MVRALILLDKTFAELFDMGSFSVSIKKRFLRWYDGKSTIREHIDRGKWQLTRDLTKQKMEECKANEHEFLEKIKGDHVLACISSQNNSKLEVIVLFGERKYDAEGYRRRVKTGWDVELLSVQKPFKDETAASKDGLSINSMEPLEGSKAKVVANKTVESLQDKNLLETPPQRIYSELDSLNNYQGTSRDKKVLSDDQIEVPVLISEEAVVDFVNKTRKGIDPLVSVLIPVKQEIIKDNVPVGEVEVIKRYRKDQKGPVRYIPYSSPSGKSAMEKYYDLSPKLKELKEIFMAAGESIEWERIEAEASITEKKVLNWLEPGASREEFAVILVNVKEQQVKNSEMTDLIKRFMTLNLDFGSKGWKSWGQCQE